MAGYDGFSMSNNARAAYRRGKMPASKLAKELGVSTAAIRNFLTPCEWHHTSSQYNRTDFYELPEWADDDETVEFDVDAFVAKCKEWDREQKATTVATSYRAHVEWVEWSGTRNHPKATKYAEECDVIEKGDTFTITRENGQTFRKRRGSNGFSVTKETKESTR